MVCVEKTIFVPLLTSQASLAQLAEHALRKRTVMISILKEGSAVLCVMQNRSDRKEHARVWTRDVQAAALPSLPSQLWTHFESLSVE